jgi:diguanylate cyclase (GGDEF)-like protein
MLDMHGDEQMLDSEQDETERLAAVERYDILDTPREEIFDRITRLACRLLKVPMAALSAIDGHRQWYKAAEGIGASEAPRCETFCTHTLQQGGPLVVSNAVLDPRFAEHPNVVGGLYVRSYAGVPLTSRDGLHIGTLCAIGTEPHSFSDDDIANLEDLARIAMDALDYRLLANTDPLTGTLSRRAFKEEGARAVALAVRHRHPLSLIVMDLDHFKSVNDSYGHAIGDAVIEQCVRTATARLRKTDLCGRLGGEEFAFILPHTERSASSDVAEQLRRSIEELCLDGGAEPFRMTASFGIAALDRATQDFDQLLAKADVALYEAKNAGRNRCRTVEASGDGRDVARRRVLKGGQIIFNNRMSTMDCTVRSLSDSGAGIDVSSSAGLPKDFILAIRADGVEIPARITAWSDRHIEVEFLSRAA